MKTIALIPWQVTFVVNLFFRYKWFCLFVHPDMFRTSVPSF